MTFMLDTDTSIYAMSRKHQSVLDQLAAHEGSVCMSSISLAELMFGAHKSQNVQQNLSSLHTFKLIVPVRVFDESAASYHGEIKAEVFRRGTPVGALDLLIGAHARSLGLTLVTNNRREFDRIPGLKVENWV
jgi:tRNA(fMet)-specific endonuclease VapC